MPAYTIAGSASSARSASASIARFSCPPGRATAKLMFGRSNPVATRSGSRSASRRTTSLATRGVAVAVDATIAAAPSIRAMSRK